MDTALIMRALALLLAAQQGDSIGGPGTWGLIEALGRRANEIEAYVADVERRASDAAKDAS